MTNPLHAAYYADSAVQQRVCVVENVPLARDTFRIRFHCPQIAKRILPGQFVMMRLNAGDDPLLARPLALYDTVLDGDQQPVGLDIVYLVVGKMTGRLAKLSAGSDMEVWGPLGNGFATPPTDHLLMVAGGIGQTPFLALARQYLGQRVYGGSPLRLTPPERVTLCYGARSGVYLAGVEDFEALGVRVRLSTDDGTCGHRGLVTDLLRRELDGAGEGTHVVCCGPEPMMEAVSQITAVAQVPCQVSLETPMACGIGICFSCVAKVRDGQGGWDYQRTCVEGPVFAAERIEW
ncbi:MAG: dihydroorotate dehydrogenase electron transfer subunit [Planctomycetales bacterium]|nr:dihydroorotate dehydrogenase electron transfer subunit [Planctomycetales bacterium]NIM09859.1 dihydroorotate dehydrogenase electron transfer subunit [Planctomycetales bacterium]NIN09299.1 dihydroorotate dehydrogenase electron transfer subunit [Planctomycetales bacterium]NIN78406.1 dihydroorotate dehydrogenase electron transfer subunit [Planctomycetales bacterium]NIO35584.1 dihydroorotate dehydrogenase electron transfer subunit [Planctomycetales bacterium]